MPEYEFGSDGQAHPVEPSPAMPAIEPPTEPTAPVDAFDASEPGSSAQRLRDFEDKHLGPKHSRLNGQIERGIGSPFAGLDDNRKAHHAALEAQIAAESEHQAAVAAADAAAEKLKAATERAEQTEGAL